MSYFHALIDGAENYKTVLSEPLLNLQSTHVTCIFIIVVVIIIIIFIVVIHHHQFLTPGIWWRWVRMNDCHCLRSLVASIAPLNVSPIDSMTSFILSIHRGLGLSFRN